MGLRRSLLAFALLGLPVSGHPEDHKWAAFAAFSRVNTGGGSSSLGLQSIQNAGPAPRQNDLTDRSGVGWHVAAEVTLHLPWIGEHVAFVGDASGHAIGEDRKTDASQFTVMVGPRVTVRVPGQIHLFAHFMGFGAIHRSDTSLDIHASTMAMAAGTGVDFTFLNKDADGRGHDGFRFQADKIIALADGVHGGWRISFGYVHRF